MHIIENLKSREARLVSGMLRRDATSNLPSPGLSWAKYGTSRCLEQGKEHPYGVE